MLLWLLACRERPPEALSSGPEGAPVVVVLHGLGDEPRSMLALVEACQLPVRIVAPRGLTPYGDGYSWFEVGGIGAELSYDEQGLMRAADVLAQALSSWRVDGEPLVVTGFSQGGMLSFALALHPPRGLDAALPIGGTFPPGRVPPAPPAGAPRLRALHGTADPVVPFAPTQQLVERLAASGWDARLIPAEGVGHAIPPSLHGAFCRELAAATAPSVSR